MSVLFFVLSFLVFFAGLKYLRYKKKKWNEYVTYTGLFHELARNLTNDMRVSDYALQYISDMNAVIDNKYVANHMAAALRKSEIENHNNALAADYLDKYVVNPEISEAEKLKIFIRLVEVSNLWILAISSLSPFSGFLLKEIWAGRFSNPDKMKAVVYKVSHQNSRTHWWGSRVRYS